MRLSKEPSQQKESELMLYNDYDITLTGPHIRVTPMTAPDAEPYARLMFGELYDGGNNQ